MSFPVFTQAIEYVDTEIQNFGGAAATFSVFPVEFAPTISLLAFSADTVAAVSLRLFLAPAAAATEENQIELFNQAIALGPIAIGRYVTLVGGQGGCERVFRAATGQPWTLRASSTGLAGVNSAIRLEWNWSRAIT